MKIVIKVRTIVCGFMEGTWGSVCHRVSDVISEWRTSLWKGFGNRLLISTTVLLWLREVQQLHVVANLKWFGFQCFNLFL